MTPWVTFFKDIGEHFLKFLNRTEHDILYIEMGIDTDTLIQNKILKFSIWYFVLVLYFALIVASLFSMTYVTLYLGREMDKRLK